MCDILTLFTLGRYWLWKQQTSPVFLLSLSHEMIWPILNIAPFFYIKDDEKKNKKKNSESNQSRPKNLSGNFKQNDL